MKKWWNFEWHWSNDNEHRAPDDSIVLGSPWKHGRFWLYYNLSRESTTRTFAVEWTVWSHFWHVYTSCSDNDEQITFSIGCGLFAIWISLGNIIPYKWLPTRKVQSSKDPTETFEIIQDRQIGVHLRNGSVDISLWEDPTSWSNTQPKWWSFSIPVVHFLLGRAQNKTIDIYDKLIALPLPEQNYLVHVFLRERVRKRPRWFSKRNKYGAVKIDPGIPMPEKHGGSYLAKETGQKGTTVEEVIGNTVHWVLKERQNRWGSYEPK